MEHVGFCLDAIGIFVDGPLCVCKTSSSEKDPGISTSVPYDMFRIASRRDIDVRNGGGLAVLAGRTVAVPSRSLPCQFEFKKRAPWLGDHIQHQSNLIISN